jgi:hypothetical protein
LLSYEAEERRLSMKSLRLVTALSVMLGAALAVPVSTEAAERDRHSSRSYSSNRYDRRDGGRGRSYSYRSPRSFGRSYAYGPRYSYSYRRPYYPYAYTYGYDPYFYDDYYAPVYARPYYGPRVGVVVGRPRVGLYLGW